MPSQRFITTASLNILSLFMVACSSGGSSGEADTVEPKSQTPSCEEREAGVCTELDATTLTQSLETGDTAVFRIGSGANVALRAEEGSAELYLFDNLEDIDPQRPWDNTICTDTWGFKDNVCSASTEDGDMFAYVESPFEDSQIEISATQSCTTNEVNQWIYSAMTDFYYFADEVPNIDISTFEDPDELVEALRFEERDPYSGVQRAQNYNARLEEGILFGLGVRWRYDDNDDLTVHYTFAESPFGQAGIDRGDIVETLNGQDIKDISSEEWVAMVGDEDNPKASTWGWIDNDTGERKSSTVTIGSFKANTVLHSEVIYNAQFSVPIGYISFKSFYETSTEELNEVISQFSEAGVSELVLDLRYNGGGRGSVGRELAVQIAGDAAAGMIATKSQHNREYSRYDFERDFPDETAVSLNLGRVLVLTSSSTASASEALVNSLRPYIDVVVFGNDKTAGKPFSSYSRQYCGYALSAMQHINVNINDISVEGGVELSCAAEDDVTRDFGTLSGETEGMLSTAIDYLVSGSCEIPGDAPAIATRSAFGSSSLRDIETGFGSFDELADTVGD